MKAKKLLKITTSTLLIFLTTVFFNTAKIQASNYYQKLVKNYDYSNSPDWITGEIYTYDFLYYIRLDTKTKIVYADLRIVDKQNNIKPQYFGVFYSPVGEAKPNPNIPPKYFHAKLIKTSSFGYYKADKEIKLDPTGCFTIYKKMKNNPKPILVGTSCYKENIIVKGKNLILSAPGNNLEIRFDYTGNKNTVILLATPLFKGGVPKNWGVYKLTRVHYITNDWRTSSLRDFKNVSYKIKWVRGHNQNKELLKVVCGEKQDFRFKPYLHRTFNSVLPNGGSFIAYSTKNPKECSFTTKKYNYLQYGFFSHSPMIVPTKKQINKKPIIITSRLKDAVLYAPYKEVIEARDKDGDMMNIKVHGLPKGLYATKTSNYKGRATTTIKGAVKNSKLNALYTLKVVVTDSKGGVDIKFLKLRVTGKFIGKPIPVKPKPIKIPYKRLKPININGKKYIPGIDG